MPNKLIYIIKGKAWRLVVVETDCLKVVQSIPIDMVSAFGLVIKDCKMLLINLCELNIFFIKHLLIRLLTTRTSCSFADRIY